MGVEHVWQVVEARSRLKEIIDAALTDGPQLIRRRNDDVVVVVSVKDWEARQSTLKDWLLSDIGRTDDLLAGGEPIEISGFDLGA
jgi:prevent-host-death family protein